MDFLLLNHTIKIFYGLGTVENVHLKINLLFLLSKKNNMQLPIEGWKLILTYLRLNDLIEISCVCKHFYLLCENNHFYVKKFNQSKKIFKDRSWLVHQYRQILERFYFNLFHKSVKYVPIENLHATKKIIYNKLYFSFLPFRVWDHMFLCCRSQYESNMSMFCTKVYLRNKKICDAVEKK